MRGVSKVIGKHGVEKENVPQNRTGAVNLV